MEAVILAGGFGTRLAHVVSDVPKPMAPINGKPFLQILLDDLAKKGVSRVILAVGYKKECIMHYFGNSYNGLDIDYSIEDKPLFTGGAIKKALQMCKEDNVVIANGDTFFNVDIVSMLEAHMANAADLTIAAKRMSKFERYGTLKINSNGVIQGFCEKQYCEAGNINGGVYIIKRDALKFEFPEKFSFEAEFLEKKCNEKLFIAFLSDGYFIDIGIPQDYLKAQGDFKHYE